MATAKLRLQRDVFEQSKRFSREERYALTDQIRRSSRSVGAVLAEAWHERRHVAHFAGELTDADVGLGEPERWFLSRPYRLTVLTGGHCFSPGRAAYSDSSQARASAAAPPAGAGLDGAHHHPPLPA